MCVFYSTINSQKTIKDEIAAINHQSYSKYHVEINDRGSTDNTHIIASYTLKEIFGDKQAKIILKTNKDEGVFTGFKRFINECPIHSIILVIGDNDTFLGSNHLETVDRIFATEGLDIAVFSGLETTHLNLELYN